MNSCFFVRTVTCDFYLMFYYLFYQKKKRSLIRSEFGRETECFVINVNRHQPAGVQ